MSECKDIRRLLALRAEDLDAGERAQIKAHLAACPHCAAIAEVYAEQNRVIRDASRVGLTPSQRGQFLSTIQRERRRHEMYAKLPAAFSTAAAIAALIVLALALQVLLPSGDRSVTSVLSIPQPTETLTTDLHKVKFIRDVPSFPQGQLQWPTTRREISGWTFHDPRNPDHIGLDVAAARGDPIFAVADGVVTLAGWEGGYGKLVVVEHTGGWFSYYAQLEEIVADIGQQVKQGELLGKAGSTGFSSGPHLHFELRYHDHPVDPLDYLLPISTFEMGGHVSDESLPFANRMHYAGMSWAKVQVPYGQDPSRVITAAHANGFKIQLTALGPVDMVTEPTFEQDFARWVASMAAAGADAIEIWNEPNIDREWQGGRISPEAYTNLLCTAYSAIKAANPDTLVISAAPTPTSFFGGCTADGCDDDLWIKGLYSAGASDCLDYIGAHYTAGATSPAARSGHPADEDGHHSWYFLPQTTLYYDAFNGAHRIFYTEMGYASQEGVSPFPNAFAWARHTSNGEQADWLAEAVQLSMDTGMVHGIIVWNVDFSRHGNDPQDGYAIIRPDGGCPACDALHDVLGTR